MERETRKFALPSGKEIEVRTYLTARERNELRNVFLKGVSIDPATGQQKGDVFAAELLDAGNRKLIELAVVSLEGSAENISERLLDGSPEDYDFVVAEANKIGNFKQPK